MFNWINKTKTLSPDFYDKNFHEIIAIERARSDRGNNIFSIIFFEIGEFCTKNQKLLIDKFYNHLRIIDRLGCYDNRHIAIILPNTTYENAHKTARRLCKEAGISQSSCFTINSYPLNRVIDNNNGSVKDVHIDVLLDKYSSVPENKLSSKPNDIKIFKSVVNSIKNQLRNREKTIQKFSLYQFPQVPLWKRPIDITGAIAGLILFSPFMLAIAFAIKSTSKGPVIFTQKRAGLGGKPFDFYKFRSMVVDAETKKKDLMAFNERTGPVFKMTDDPRITYVGKFIRKLSLDELPQFYNVLKGDMSLVGPRPLPVDEDSGCEQWHRIRRDIKPGITCLWQIKARGQNSFDDWIRLDIEYYRRQSLLLDLKILALTLPTAILKRGR